MTFDVSPFPKLKALHGAMRSDSALATYFASDMYKTYAPPHLPMCTWHAEAHGVRVEGHAWCVSSCASACGFCWLLLYLQCLQVLTKQ